jgi:hypothetical protein
MPQDRTPGPIKGKSKAYEETSFTVAKSPVEYDVHLNLGRNSTEGYVVCDGPGDIKLEFSSDGVVFSDQHTLKEDEILELEYYDIHTIRVTSSGVISAYRILVI